MSEPENNFDIRTWGPYQLWRLSQDMGYILEDYYGKKFSLSGEGWRFMAMLASVEPVTAKTLGELLDRNQVQVTRALGRLIDMGYVSRKAYPKDRRMIILNLSSKGEQVFQAIAHKAEALEQAFIDDLSVQEQEIFKKSLKHLQQKTRKMRQEVRKV